MAMNSPGKKNLRMLAQQASDNDSGTSSSSDSDSGTSSSDSDSETSVETSIDADVFYLPEKLLPCLLYHHDLQPTTCRWNMRLTNLKRTGIIQSPGNDRTILQSLVNAAAVNDDPLQNTLTAVQTDSQIAMYAVTSFQYDTESSNYLNDHKRMFNIANENPVPVSASKFTSEIFQKAIRWFHPVSVNPNRTSGKNPKSIAVNSILLDNMDNNPVKMMKTYLRQLTEVLGDLYKGGFNGQTSFFVSVPMSRLIWPASFGLRRLIWPFPAFFICLVLASDTF